MKKILITIFPLVLLVPFVFTGCGKKPEGFPGKYYVESFFYTADLTIKEAGDGYRLTWEMADGSTHHGVGIELDSILAVYFASDTPKIMAYKREGKFLTAIWVTPGMTGVNFERSKDALRLHRAKYDLSGTYLLNPPTDTVITEAAEVDKLILTLTNLPHAATWEMADGTVHMGIGFALDTLAVFGYDDGEQVHIGIYRKQGDRLNGRMADVAYSRTATKDPITWREDVAVKVSEPEPEELPEEPLP